MASTWITQDAAYAPPDDLLGDGSGGDDAANNVVMRLSPYNRVADARRLIAAARAEGREGLEDLAPIGPAALLARGLNPTCDVRLLGTAHVSAESCDQVRAAIAAFKPDVVVLELCKQRKILVQPLPPGGEGAPQKVPTLEEMLRQYKSGTANPLHLIMSWFSAVAAAELGTSVGAEFRAAHEAARAIGAGVVFGDRLLTATIARVYAARPKIFAGALFTHWWG